MMSNGVISPMCIGRLPAMNTTEPYSPTARAKARAKPVMMRRSQCGQDDDAGTSAQRVAPSEAAASSNSGSSSSRTGWTVRTTKGSPMNMSAMKTARSIKGQLEPLECVPIGQGPRPGCLSRPPTQIGVSQLPAERPGDPFWWPVLRIDRTVRAMPATAVEQRKRQIHERIHDPPAGKLITHKHPGENHTEQGSVEQRGEKRRPKGQPDRKPRPRAQRPDAPRQIRRPGHPRHVLMQTWQPSGISTIKRSR